MNLLKQLFSKFSKPAPVINLKKLVDEGALIIDVRTRDEFSQGHIDGSINIPVMELGTHLKELMRNDCPVITVCLTGARSSMATDILKKNDVIVYNGGCWQDLNNLLTMSA